MKLLKGNEPCVTNIVGATELQIVIDFSHEPWKTIAMVVLRNFNEQLGEVGYRVGGFEDMIDIINQDGGDLQ